MIAGFERSGDWSDQENGHRRVKFPRQGDTGNESIRITMLGCTFFQPDPRLADVVDAIWDVDVADADIARAATIRVLPTTSPLLIVHYRAPMRSGAIPAYKRIANGIQTRASTIRPSGAIGAILVRLKAQTACLLFGCDIAPLTDASVGLDNIFGDTGAALLEEMLAEADDSRERVARVQRFLLERISESHSDPTVMHAMICLRRNPDMPMKQLAAQLHVSERHLQRRFKMMTGTSPKMFARVARVEKIVAARLKGTGWADIAYSAGYSDQAHLVNDFRSMVGAPPEAFVRGTKGAEYSGLNTFLAESDFYNTFVT